MCYPKPGPRCSKHAYEKVLKSASKLEKLNKSVSKEERKAEKKHGKPYLELHNIGIKRPKTINLSNAIDAKEIGQMEYRNAVESYLQTPKGIESLKARYGEEHPITEEYIGLREEQMDELRATNPKYAKKAEEDKEPSTHNNLGEMVSQHVEGNLHYQGIIRAEKHRQARENRTRILNATPSEAFLMNLDMKDIKRSRNQILGMEAGDTVYVAYDGEITKDPGEHPHRSSLTLLADSEEMKVYREEYNADYYKNALANKTLKEARKKSRRPLYEADEIMNRIRSSGNTRTHAISVSEHDSDGYVTEHELSRMKREDADIPEAYDDLSQRQKDMSNTIKTINSLTKKRNSYSASQSDTGQQKDPEMVQLFDSKISEGYTKLIEQKSAFNHVNREYAKEADRRRFEESDRKEQLQQEKQIEENLKLFKELKTINFD